jgi:predicted Zn-dependent protease
MFGLPIGSDMDGRVLLESFARPPKIERIASWDQESGPADPGLHPPDLRQDPYLSAEAIDQLIALGYLPEPARDQRLAADVARREASFNLAATHLYVGRAAQARPILEELYRAHPDEPRFGQWLARVYAKLNLHRECRAMMEAVQSKLGRNVDGDLLLAAAMYNSGDSSAAHALLADIQRQYPPTPTLFTVLGGMYLSDRRWADAQRAYEHACEMDDDHEQAHFGLSRALAEQGQFERSAEHALRAVGLVHFFPAAHYQLGVALEGMGQIDRAIKMMEAAVAQSPHFADAHRHLARLYHARNDVTNALKHERAAEGYARDARGGNPT